MKDKERVRLTVNGQETIELDYKGIHPTLLYAEAGISFDGDPYDIPGYPTEFRKLIKIAFNTMVNAGDRKRAARSVLQQARALTEAGTIPDGCCSPQAINTLLDAIEVRHRPIRRAFYSDAGIRLQRIDSDMAESVVLNLARQGIPTLPVHDSFITEKQHSNRLEEAMEKALKRAMKSSDDETDFSRHISVSNQKEISPSDLHTASDLQDRREALPGYPPEPSSFLALAWVLASFLPPPYGLALILGVSARFRKFRAPVTTGWWGVGSMSVTVQQEESVCQKPIRPMARTEPRRFVATVNGTAHLRALTNLCRHPINEIEGE